MRLPQLMLLAILALTFSCRSAKQQSEQTSNILTEDKELNLNSEKQLLQHISSKAARYFGVINLHDLKISLPLEMALIPRSRNGKDILYFLQAKAHFASYSNKEYFLAFDNSVSFDTNKGTWEFSKEDKVSEILFLSGESREEHIVGNLSFRGSSEYSYSVKLLDEGDPSAESYLKQAIYPIRQAITGVFQANTSCQELPNNLVLEVVRLPTQESLAAKDEYVASNLKIFGAFNRHISSAESDQKLEANIGCKDVDCKQQKFFDSHLNLSRLSFLAHNGIECELLENDVVCGSCQYSRIDNSSKNSEILLSRDFEGLTENVGQIAPKTKLLVGEYFGLLHHAGLNQWQIVRLNITSETKEGFVNGVVNYFFGLPSENKYLLEKFHVVKNEKNETLLNQVLVGEEDSIIEIKPNGGEQLLIEWFSRTHGYIGQALLQPGRQLKIPKEISRPLITLFDGKYRNEAADYTVELQQPVSGQAQYPNLRGESATFLNTGTDSTVLTKQNADFSHYDMYTGELAAYFKSLGWIKAHINSDQPARVSAWVDLPPTHQLHGTFTALNFKRVVTSIKH
ncbi:MAG: hypothetical protein KBD78_02340 [Oligoflexales bacterium]|nr:hypothetical protein [Oligoflexales bacterium]